MPTARTNRNFGANSPRTSTRKRRDDFRASAGATWTSSPILAAFDITLEQARRIPSPLGDLPTGGRTIPPEDFYIELAAYGLSVEAPNARFCERILRALKTNYRFTDGQITWFSMHAVLDADHGDEFLKYVEAAATHANGLERVRTNTLALCATTKLIWNGAGKWQ